MRGPRPAALLLALAALLACTGAQQPLKCAFVSTQPRYASLRTTVTALNVAPSQSAFFLSDSLIRLLTRQLGLAPCQARRRLPARRCRPCVCISAGGCLEITCVCLGPSASPAPLPPLHPSTGGAVPGRGVQCRAGRRALPRPAVAVRQPAHRVQFGVSGGAGGHVHQCQCRRRVPQRVPNAATIPHHHPAGGGGRLRARLLRTPHQARQRQLGRRQRHPGTAATAPRRRWWVLDLPATGGRRQRGRRHKRVPGPAQRHHSWRPAGRPGLVQRLGCCHPLCDRRFGCVGWGWDLCWAQKGWAGNAFEAAAGGECF